MSLVKKKVFREAGYWPDSGRDASSTLLLGKPGVLAETASNNGFVNLCDGYQDSELMLSDSLKIYATRLTVMQLEVLFSFMKHEN